MTQNDPSDFTAAESGTAHVSRHNTRALSWMSLNKGPTTPSYAVAGTLWLDDTDNPIWYAKIYDGVSDIATPFKFDATNNIWADPHYIADTGAANAAVLTLVPALVAYAAGQTFRFKATALNTGAATVNISGLGIKAIEFGGNALRGGEIRANDMVEIMYDGTAFQIIGPAVDEGTFTPTLTFGGASSGMIFSVQTGAYRRFDSFCYFRATLLLTNKGVSTGIANAGGLPFTIAASSSGNWPMNGEFVQINFNAGAGYYSGLGIGGQNTTGVDLYEVGDNVTRTILTDADFVNASQIIVTGGYAI